MFTLVGAGLVLLTLQRGASDPVCGMRVDRYATEYTANHEGRAVYFCSADCKAAFEASPERYADELRGTLGWRPRRLLKPRA